LFGFGDESMPPTGLKEGKEMICVKCLCMQRQIVDYGQPPKYTLHSDLGISPGIIGYCDTTIKITWDTLK